MIVQHNLQAMNSNRMLGLTTKTVSGSTEKLSSGYKINRAADDAAGLAISEKMRKQVRGLTQAATNSEDGISCVQTAEGAMSEVQDMLQRMNELCVQAANGTNSRTDRQYIQDEIDQLISEIDRVSETTKFNETYLLKGDSTKDSKNVYSINYSTTYTRNIVSNAVVGAPDYKVNYTGNIPVYITDKAILTSKNNISQTSEMLTEGDDLTDYMRIKDYDIIDNQHTITEIEVWDSQGNAVAINNSNLYNYFSYDSDSNKYHLLSSEIDLYTSQTTQNDDTRLTDDYYNTHISHNTVTHPDIYKIGSTTLTEANVSQAFEPFGTYNNSVDRYVYNTTSNKYEKDKTLKEDEINSVIFNYDNHAKVEFNTLEYAALVSVELDSRVAIGSSGQVHGTSDYSYDLSTNGIDEKVRANKSLYIYDTKNETITHLSAGDEMDKYLTDEHTMKDEYRLLDILDSEKGVSNRVMKQLFGATDTTGNGMADTNISGFYWTDAFVELDTSYQKLYDINGTEVSGVGLNKYFDDLGNYKGGLYTTSQARVNDIVLADSAIGSTEYNNLMTALGKTPPVISDYITITSTKVQEELDLELQGGADSDRSNKLAVTIQSLSAAGLGINKLSSKNIGIVDDTGNNATDAIDVVAAAIQKISEQRAALGAIQNRLEHTIKNLDNIVENTTSAEASIRDTDMAEEMVKYANANILQQAGQSMLAQANQSNQGVMSLLQG